MRPNVIISVGSFNAALAIALSAYAAHGLERHVDLANVTTFTTGADFHLWHSLGLIVIGILAKQFETPEFGRIAVIIICGILLFSGSLYGLSITGIKSFAYVTPLGGLSFIIAWLWLAVLTWRLK
jgi:uncharacterized membrane protein YgdD (TMEM256/DUF423 family)